MSSYVPDNIYRTRYISMYRRFLVFMISDNIIVKCRVILTEGPAIAMQGMLLALLSRSLTQGA